MQKRGSCGQVAVEYIIIAAFLLIIISTAYFFASSSLDKSVQDAKARTAVNTLASAIDQAYALGPGTKMTVELDLPYDIQDQIVEDELIGYVVDVSGANSHYYADTKASLVGNLPLDEGYHEVILEVNDSGQVQIGSNLGIYLTPVSKTINLTEGNPYSEIHTYNLSNLNNSLIGSIVIGETGTITDFVSLPSVPSTLAGDSNFNFDVTITVPDTTSPGTYTGYITADSNGGSDTSLVQIIISPDVGDTTPPVITLTAPDDSSTDTDGSVTFSYTVTDTQSSILSCELIIDSVSVQTDNTAPFDSFSETLSNGTYDWDVNCTDSSGNEGTAINRTLTVNVVTDFNAPVVLLTTPATGSIVSDASVDFNFIVTDESNIDTCYLIVGGSTVSSISSPTKDINQTINYSLTQLGTNLWDVNCVDQYGYSAISTNGVFIVNYSPSGPGSQNYQFTYQVTTGSDDAEERADNGSMDITSADLDIPADNKRNYYTGTRFLDVHIPSYAIVNNITLTFVIKTNRTDATDIVIYGEKALSPATFTTTSSDISNRTKTTASVTWSSVPSPGNGMPIISPNLSSIVEEIIAQPGWVTNSPMVFILEAGTGRREVNSFESSVNDAPTLFIDYNA